jgi:hypothetical protein
VALGSDGWDADMAVEQVALLRLAAQHREAGVGGRLAAGHSLVAERFGTIAVALTPGALATSWCGTEEKFAMWWLAAESWSTTASW